MKTYRFETDHAFTLVEFLIVCAVLAILVALFLPSVFHRRHDHYRVQCVNNLKMIGLSFKTWALDNNDLFPMQVSVTNGGTMELIANGKTFPSFAVMSNELSTPRVLLCPKEMDSVRRPASSFSAILPPVPGLVPLTDGNISYFINAEATDSGPAQVLSGDHTLSISNVLLKPGLHFVPSTQSLTWHKRTHPKDAKGVGNILLSDGSVHRTPAPPRLSTNANLGNVRLLIP
jgi:prepilin-type N-terminal cleavage/methylation domain-containing protein